MRIISRYVKLVRRIEFIAKRNAFSDNNLFYCNQFVPGDEPTFKPVPPIEEREELVRRAHYLGHFAYEKNI